MQTQDLTVHAVRILTHLHERQGSVQTGLMIAKSVGISYLSFMQIARRLKRRDLLVSTYARKDGYALGRPVHEISVHDVFSCFEGEKQTNPSLHGPARDLRGNMVAGMSSAEAALGSPQERLYSVETVDKKVHMIPLNEVILIQPSPQQGILELHQEHGLLEFRGQISRAVGNVREFFRSHMSVVVNINHIKHIDVEKREIELTNGRLVPIAKQKIPVLSRLMANCDLVAGQYNHGNVQ